MTHSVRIFYTSDLHFGHHNLYKNGIRKFSCAEECENLIRENFNRVIMPTDKLYILGDLSLSANYDDLARYLKSINGIKTVILGNHDRPSTLDKLKEDHVIANWHYWKGVRDHGIPAFLTHFVPLEAHTGPEPRVYLYGHVHGLLKSVFYCPLMHDVGVDANDYKPFSLDRLDLNLIDSIRLNAISCPYRKKGALCDVCTKFIEMKAARRKQESTALDFPQ